MAQDHLRITFVGHIDHGKSSLIGRLLYETDSVPEERMEQVRAASAAQGRDAELAYLVDHLKEERDRGITIDTAQIFFRTPGRECIVIDAPGHREFLKNMLTGASQAEAAILIVDAEEGLREQTRRHAFLLRLLSIHYCVVVVNKMDLVAYAQERFEEVREAVGQFLERVGLAAADFIPISAKHGDNVTRPSDRMPWYQGLTILELLDTIPSTRETSLPARFCVQDVYHFGGQRMIAGRLETGTLGPGDSIHILPDGLDASVESVERFESPRTLAEAGECVALILPPDAPARRGQVYCDPLAPPQVVTTLTARLFWMREEPLAVGDDVTLKIATQESACRVRAIRHRIDSSSLDVLEEEAQHLGTTEVADLELEAASPMVAELVEQNPSLGRLVLELDGAVAGAGTIVAL